MQKTRIVIGCNYHTTWQREKGMRFVLIGVQGNKALMKTRRTNRKFWTDIESLIFIETDCNISKAKRKDQTCQKHGL